MSRLEPVEYGGAFNALDVGLIVLDTEERILGWNRWMAAAAGISEESARGRKLQEVLPEAARSRLPNAVSQALSAGTSSILTHSLNASVLPLKTKAGRDMLHNVTVRPIEGEPLRCLVQVTDVTVATERDHVLRQRQNARYDAVVNSAPDAIVTLDTHGIIHLVNPAAAREFGYEARDLVGQSVDQLFEDHAAWQSVRAALLAGEPTQRPIELLARRKDGSEFYLEMSASRWHAGAPVFVTAILRDISERRASEEALRRLNQTLEQRVAERTADRDRMWRLSTDVMLVWQPDGRISSINPAWMTMLGWDEAALIGMNFRDLIVEEDKAALDSALRDLASSRSPTRFELRVRARGGGDRSISWIAVPADHLFQAVGRDVTAARQAEEALRATEEALRQSQKMEAIGQLSGGIAHDFNNLLTGIIGAMEVLKQRIKARRYDDLDKFMNAAVNSANSAAALTHRLLTFARRQPLNQKPLDVNRLIGGMEDLLRRSLGEQMDLELSLGSGVWPTLTDANQLESALLNLAINARDAIAETGRLTIETANVVIGSTDMIGREDMVPGDYTMIRVADNGAGMSRETLARAFDPFFTTKPIGQGTGLGLSMVYGFAKQSRGHVQIDSELGHGTKVKLLLPRYRGALSNTEGSHPADAPLGSGETVLLVEDDPSVRLLVAEVLREIGYVCLEAKDGQAALPILISHVRLDLMITDVGLPGLNGVQLAEIGRQHRPDLKVLFVSGYAERAAVTESGLGLGMELVTKPFRLELLCSKVREMVGASRKPPKLAHSHS